MSFNTQPGGIAMPTDQATSLSLSRQLHDATQPLTVLQGSLELALIESRTVEEYKKSVERALRELARVFVCFEELRHLVALQQRDTERDTENQNSGVNHV